MTLRERAEQIVEWGYGPKQEGWTEYQQQLADRITTAIQAASNEQLERCRAHDRQADVAAFVRKFGQSRRESPGWPDQRDLDMRIRLISEEYKETLNAAGYEVTLEVTRPQFEDGEHVGGLVIVDERDDIGFGLDGQEAYEHEERDLAEMADGLIDLEYVTLGTHETLGIDSNPLWAEVNAANMRKEGGATRHDGKILKPRDWVGPDIEGALRKQGWSDERGDKGFGSTGR